MEKEIRIDISEGYEVDREKSTFECIRFRKKNENTPWSKMGLSYDGWVLDGSTATGIKLKTGYRIDNSKDSIFFGSFHARSAIAMTKISQIMVHDERFGGFVSDSEWKDYSVIKYCIHRYNGEVTSIVSNYDYYFLAFHTKAQMDLFMEENMDLIKDYLMLS